MKSSDDLKPGSDSNIFLFKGDPVTRKTANAGSFPDPVIFDLDGKVGAVKVAHPTKKFNYEFYSPHDYKRFANDFDGICEKNPYKGRTIVIDSLTSFVKMAIQYSLSFRGDVKKRNEGHAQVGGVELAGWDDYKFEGQVIDNLLAGIKELCKDSKVILVAHVTGTDTFTQDDGGKVVFRTLFTAGRNARVLIPGLFKEIYHFYARKPMDAKSGKITYVVRTGNSDLDYASTMLPLPPEMDVTDGNLYGTMQKHLKEKGIDF